MKLFLKLLLVIVVIGSVIPLASATSACPILRGDLNYDGTLSVTDIQVVINEALQTRPLSGCADFTNDGNVNILDAIYLKNLVMNYQPPNFQSYPMQFISNGVFQGIITYSGNSGSDGIAANDIALGIAQGTGINVNTIPQIQDTFINTIASRDSIIVSTRCTNVNVAQLLGSCNPNDLPAGTAKMSLHQAGEKDFLVIKGADSTATRKAAKVLINYRNYNLVGSEICVGGSSQTPQIIPC